MASDDDYMAFLDKANKDPSEGHEATATTTTAQAAGTRELKTTDRDVEMPAPLRDITGGDGVFYTSDADEPFVPVALRWDEGGKGLPDEEEFAGLVEHWDRGKASIEIMDPSDWDTQGQYKNIIDAVRKAGKGNDVRVYRVPKTGVKIEYWVVTTEGFGKDALLVGVKALAVES